MKSEIDDKIAQLTREIEVLQIQRDRLETEKAEADRERLEAKMVKVVCPECDGYGEICSDGNECCARCGGDGYLLAAPFLEKTRPCDDNEIQAMLELSEIDR